MHHAKTLNCPLRCFLALDDPLGIPLDKTEFFSSRKITATQPLWLAKSLRKRPPSKTESKFHLGVKPIGTVSAISENHKGRAPQTELHKRGLWGASGFGSKTITEKKFTEKPRWIGIGWKRERTFSWFHPPRYLFAHSHLQLLGDCV